MEGENVRPLGELGHKISEIVTDLMNLLSSREILLKHKQKRLTEVVRREGFCWAAIIDRF